LSTPCNGTRTRTFLPVCLCTIVRGSAIIARVMKHDARARLFQRAEITSRCYNKKINKSFKIADGEEY